MKIRAERRQVAEREMHARAKWLETWSSGGGISEGGERGGTKVINRPNQLTLKFTARV